MCMCVLRFQDQAESAATLDRWSDLIVAVHNAPMGQGKQGAVESYLIKIENMNIEKLRDIVQRTIGTGDELMNLAERLGKEGEARGEARGEVRGEARGKAEGRTEHAVETALRLLTRRFGEPTEAVALRVRGASLVDLDRWTERVLDARTLDDVFAAK